MSSVFDRFPSAQDLLSRPVLRRLTQSLDRQIVVGRVKQYLGELKTQVEQASNEGKLPSITGLAERIARWIAEREQLGPRVVINATGNVFSTDLVHAPVAESACAAMVSAALGGVYASDSGDKALVNSEERLAKLVGAEATLVCNSLSASLALLFAARLADRRVLIRRGDVIELTDGLRLSELASANRVDLAEVGASNLVRLEDFAVALQTEATAWLRIGTDSPGEQQPIKINRVREQSSHDISVVEVLTHATVADWSDFGLPMLPVIGQRMAAGVDLVVFPGDCWLGGPAVGIVAGSKKLIEDMKQVVDRYAAQVDSIRLAGLEATLRMYDDPTSVAEKHPLLSLLCASPENLKNRADRIAPQLAALAGVADCQVIEGKAVQSPLPQQTTTVASYQLRVLPKQLSLDEVWHQLTTHPQFSILPVASEQELLFDLRSVHPRYDAELVARIAEVFVNGSSSGA